MKYFRYIFWLSVLFCNFFPTILKASSQPVILVDNAQQAPDFEIDSFVTTDRGNTFISAKSSTGAYDITPRVSTGGQPLFQLKSGSVASGLLAHNSGSSLDTLVIMSYHPADGYLLHTLSLQDKTNGSGKEFTVDTSAIGTFPDRCTASPNHISVSGGYQGRIAFASDCLTGEYDLGLRRVIWSYRDFNTVYAAIPPAIDSRGRVHFLVRPGAGRLLEVIRTSRSGGLSTIARFNEFLPPAANAELSQYPINGMIVLADDSVLLTGTSGYKKITAGVISDIALSSLRPWGIANAVNSQQALYLPVVDSDTGTQLSIREVTFNPNNDPTDRPQATLNANSQRYPATIGLARDSSALKLVYFANGDIYRHNTKNFNSDPEQSDVIAPFTEAETFGLETGLASPVNLLFAGKETFVKGTRAVTRLDTGAVIRSSTLYRLFNEDASGTPFTKNLRGFWAQPGADEQHSNSVPGGVEVFLNEDKFANELAAKDSGQENPVIWAALKCFPLDDPDQAILIPESGVFLNSNQRLLSVVHDELTQGEHYGRFVTGMECEPFALTVERPLIPDQIITSSGAGATDMNSTSVEAPDTGGTTYAGNLVAGNSLGDLFQLQIAGFDQVPLWSTNLPEVNGVLTSEVTAINDCLQGQDKCNGYRRLVIGRIGDGSDDGQQTTNKTDVDCIRNHR